MSHTLNGHEVRWKSVRWGRGGGWLEPGSRGHPTELDRHSNHIHHSRGGLLRQPPWEQGNLKSHRWWTRPMMQKLWQWMSR